MSDAWRYCDNLNDPEAIKALVQAAITAQATVDILRGRRLTPRTFLPYPIGRLYSVSYCTL